ncbi:type II toxin-antitoxin system death-on-curing family toxin [Rivularia sp. UHCC 0363]|uniref:type II toxin-antitoxin system death-on-curing family toxin n=1 Tax=Rivularia sp. UHCC 0363 TaxID=3110244 RepID=UPI002B213580|nr:type II toxin-antitoxin system death-on-curing family toxin [Rivularia sp. UHCC 0363]MEA5593443.1 type II toxin-antitoxin system death-on-curing family toxin [Rivularia sp. UHCC 0363]
MTETYYWLAIKEVIALQIEVIKDYGGCSGILDEGALESTLYRPQQLAYYEPLSNICDLAAAYGYGLVKNHCFVDGNKRIGFVVMAVFLLRNGYELIATELEAVDIMINLAQGNISQNELGSWLTRNSVVL